jgi:hypothetical protein
MYPQHSVSGKITLTRIQKLSKGKISMSTNSSTGKWKNMLLPSVTNPL